MVKSCVIVHGGAGNIGELFVERYNAGTKHAARVGFDCLLVGHSALDAVERAVNTLEDNPAFNAGHGSCLTETGTVEMDAIIVDGSTLQTSETVYKMFIMRSEVEILRIKCFYELLRLLLFHISGGRGEVGVEIHFHTCAVACVGDISNPVSLARKVMEKTSHCLLMGDGAMKFAKKINFPILDDPSELITKDAIFKSFLGSGDTFSAHIEAYMNTVVHSKDSNEIERVFNEMMKEKSFTQKNSHDTVGAVAIDTNGRIACATSTGGLPGKMLGRVGDSPLIGSGGFANKMGGCSTTGHGESILRTMMAREAVRYLEEGVTAMEAAKKAVERTLELTDGRCGLVLLDKDGNIGHAASTASMAWASISSDGSWYGLKSGEEIKCSF